jgi:hypothetical protein
MTAANAFVGDVDLANAESARDATANVLVATNTMGQISSLTIASSYIGRAGTNLANAST